jgi:pimeloyl-ACP methyl ester carboxylesterase
MGSIVAQRVAAARPWITGRLVLIGAADSAAGNPVLKELAGAILQLPDPPPVDFVRAFRANIARSLPQTDCGDAFVADSVKLTKRVWQETVCGLLVDRQTVAARIRIPALVLWGEGDGVFGATTQKRLCAGLRLASFVSYGETGHAPHWERPGLLSSSIRSFLKARGSAGTARSYASR